MNCIICNSKNTHRNNKVVQCSKCFHTYRDYGKINLENYYTNDYRSKIVVNGPTDSLLEQRNQEKFNLIKKHINKENTLLEIGFGRGHFYKKFKENFDQEKYYCCEINKNLSENAKNLGINVFSGSFQEIETNMVFDIVASFDVLEHFENPYDYKKKLCKVLKPGGLAIVQVPIDRSLHSRLPFDGHYHYFSENSIKFLFDSEFECINVIKTNPGQVAGGKEMIAIFRRKK